MNATEVTQPHASAEDWRGRTTITVEETAPLLGISRSSAYEAARAGQIPTLRIGRRLVVPVGALRRLLGEDPMNETNPAGQQGSLEAKTAGVDGDHAPSS